MASDPNIAIEAGDTLDNLVDQFSDPFAFLRELVQNSIDAGSHRVDIEFEFTPHQEGNRGVFVLHVNDTGEGMTREIIDTKLTRLFSSAKEDDYTKIGKFGIGFVSIFALKPKAVFLDTGRDGEFWRLHFKEDRTFDRYVLPRPVEGTQIKFIKELTPQENEEYRARALRTLKLWCKHAEAEIYVDGEIINEPFELQHPLAVSHEALGTSVSACPTFEERPFFGFYNRGLTLAEGNESVIPGVAFKIRSRYLEHTLTRDNVIKDKNYDKAMVILREAVDKSLKPALFKAAELKSSDEILGYLAYHLNKLPEKLEQAPIVPTFGKRNASIREIRREVAKHKELLYERQANGVVQGLTEEGRVVVRWAGPQAEPGLGALLRILKCKVVAANAVYACPTPLTTLPAAQSKLIAAAMNLLHRAGSPYRKVVVGNFHYPDSSVADRIYLPCVKPGELIRLDKRMGLFQRLLPWNKETTVMLNVAHEFIEPHFRLKSDYRKVGPMLLATAIITDDGLPPRTINKLLEASLALEQEEAGAGG